MRSDQSWGPTLYVSLSYDCRGANELISLLYSEPSPAYQDNLPSKPQLATQTAVATPHSHWGLATNQILLGKIKMNRIHSHLF